MKNRIFKWLMEEIINTIPAVVFFLVVLNLIFFTAGLALPPGTPRYLSHTSVSIGALLIGKMLLIVNSFAFINAFPNKPLIYNIIWKFFIYGFAIVVIWSLDNYLRTYFRLKNAAHASHVLLHEYTTPIFWSSFITLLLVFLCYITFSELSRGIGKKELFRMFF